MNIKLKIFLTNWINILGIFIAVYFSSAVSELLKVQSASELPSALITGLVWGLVGVILYGAIFWLGFILAMFLLDIILMNKNKSLLKLKLAIEWGIVSAPFIYWFIQYMQWIFLIAVVVFSFTQVFRARKILAIIS